MILCFSGTGNSKYIAKKIQSALGDEIVDLNAKIKSDDHSQIEVKDRLVFVTPTYGWRMPRIVSDFVEKTPFSGEKRAWFVLDCGGEIGNAQKYIVKLCKNKGFEYMGVKGILMPENYIALFNAPDEERAKQIIKKAELPIKEAIETIDKGECFAKPRCNLYDRIMSSLVNDLFFKHIVKADKFTVSDKCIGCGKCAKLCPLNNIVLDNNKPVWGKNCTHCMACICHCPREAIEYGKKSVGKPRYHID